MTNCKITQLLKARTAKFLQLYRFARHLRLDVLVMRALGLAVLFLQVCTFQKSCNRAFDELAWDNKPPHQYLDCASVRLCYSVEKQMHP